MILQFTVELIYDLAVVAAISDETQQGLIIGCAVGGVVLLVVLVLCCCVLHRYCNNNFILLYLMNILLFIGGGETILKLIISIREVLFS